MTTDGLRTDLADVVGAGHVIVDPEVTASYTTDWTGRFAGDASLVVRPASTEEVAAVVRACRDADAPLVPQGGNTGLVGGSVPRGEPMVVLSTTRLTSAGDVDPGASQITLGAGITVAGWRAAARRAGFDAPVDFAARDVATVGGAVATNAGGSRVVRFGTMRAQVAGLRAVLADGSTIGSLHGLPKETVGVHWPSLLAGSEGTLGVITEVRLKVVPWFRHTSTALVATATLADAVGVLSALRGAVADLDAVELIMPEAMQLVATHLGASPPLATERAGAYVMVELAGHEDPTDALTTALADLPQVLDAAVTTEGPARERLVAFRDRITESISAQGVPLKLDVAVPVGALDELMTAVRRSVGQHGGRLVPFGHLAEGNVHVNVLDPGDRNGLTADVLGAAADLGGTISAEHGVGIAKSSWLHLVRTADELRAAAALKAALDPTDILNRGVLRAG